MIGTTIDGKYRIVRALGAGAMGAVYEAEHTGTGGRVALKVITGDLARNRDVVDRFQREARAAGKIDTQYITKVYDTGIDRETGLPFLAMELLSGEDFLVLIKRTGPLAPDLALRVIAQACIGLQKAHDAQVVHRDIKPANMFLARREEGEIIVKLLDFGIAKVRMEQAQETESAGLTKTGTMLGSPLYMSPEQALGSREIDHRSDIWSLGAALYQALAGKTPFDHITSLGTLIVEITSGHVPPLQEVAPWVPPQVAAIVHGALRRNANDRFQSASSMLAAIKAMLPQGWSLHESMLVPLNEAERAQVQPRMSMPSFPSLPEISLQGLAPQARPTPIPAGTGQGRWPVTEALPSSSQFLPQASQNPSLTAGAMAHSQVTQPRSSSSKVIAAVGVALVAMAGFGAGTLYLFQRKQPTAATEPEVKAQPPETLLASAPVAPPPPTPTPSVTATQPPEPVEKRFELVIFPPFASVEVEGKPMKVSENGTVELVGAPGRLLKVKVFKGSLKKEVDVTISEVGPKPPKVELFAGAGGPSQAPGTSGGSTPASSVKVRTKFQ